MDWLTIFYGLFLLGLTQGTQVVVSSTTQYFSVGEITSVTVPSGKNISATISKLMKTVSQDKGKSEGAIISKEAFQFQGWPLYLIATEQGVDLWIIERRSYKEKFSNSRVDSFDLEDLGLDKKHEDVIGMSNILEEDLHSNADRSKYILFLNVRDNSTPSHEKVYAYRLECESGNDKNGKLFNNLHKEEVKCKIEKIVSEPAEIMRFIRTSPSSIIRCKPGLTVYPKPHSSEKWILLRYCPLSNLAQAEAITYVNKLQVFEYEDKKLQLKSEIKKISLSKHQEEELQLVSLVDFAKHLVISTPRVVATLNIDEEVPLVKNLTRFSYDVANFVCFKFQNKLSCVAQGITEITSLQWSASEEDHIEGDESMHWDDITGKVIAITGAYVVAVPEYSSETDVSELDIYQFRYGARLGTGLVSFSVGNVKLVSQVFETGVFFTGVDIAVVIGKIDGKESYEVSQVFITKPSMKLEIGHIPKKSTCFGKLSGCSEVEIYYTTRSAQKTDASLSLYHISHNSSAVLPIFNQHQLQVATYRNKLILNYSSLFYGIIKDSHISIQEQDASPASHGSNYYTTPPNLKSWKDKEITLTDFPNLPPKELLLAVSKKYVAILSSVYYYNSLNLYILPDPIDQGLTILSLNSIVAWDFPVYLHKSKRCQIIILDDHIIMQRDHEVVCISVNKKLKDVEGFEAAKGEFTWRKTQQGDLLVIMEDGLEVWSFRQSNSNLERVYKLGLHKNQLAFMKYDVLKIEDAHIGGDELVFVKGKIKGGDKILGIFQCQFSTDVCVRLDEIALQSSESLVVLDGSRWLWEVEQNKAALNIYDLEVLKFELDKVLTDGIPLQRRTTFTELLDIPDLQVVPGSHGNSKIIYAPQGKFSLKLLQNVVPEFTEGLSLQTSDSFNSKGKDKVKFYNIIIDMNKAHLVSNTREVDTVFEAIDIAQDFAHTPKYVLGFQVDWEKYILRIRMTQVDWGATISGLGLFHKVSEDSYYTPRIALTIESPKKSSFEQVIQGVSRHLFGIQMQVIQSLFQVDSSPKTQLHSVLQGFIQNYTLWCESEEGSYNIERWSSIKSVSCGEFKGSMQDYIHKEAEVRSTGESSSKLTVRDNFVYSGNPNLVFMLHDQISVVTTGVVSVESALIELEEHKGKKLDLSTCSRFFENGLSDDHSTNYLEITLLCYSEDDDLEIRSLTIFEPLIHSIEEAEKERYQVSPILPTIKYQDYLDHIANLTNSAEQYVIRHKRLFAIEKMEFVRSHIRRFSIYNLLTDKHSEEISIAQDFSSQSHPDLALADISKFSLEGSHVCLFGTLNNEYRIWVGKLGDKIGHHRLENISGFKPNTTSGLLDFFAFRMEDYWTVLILEEEDIKEYRLTNSSDVKLVNLYKFSMICDRSSKKELHKHQHHLILYCWNATVEEGQSGDYLLFYNSEFKNERNGITYPQQQLIIPDTRSKRTKVASLYRHSHSLRLILTQSDSLFTQYLLREQVYANFSYVERTIEESDINETSSNDLPENRNYWGSPDPKATFKLTAENIISDCTGEICVKKPHVRWLNSDWGDLFLFFALYSLFILFWLRLKSLQKKHFHPKKTLETRERFELTYRYLILRDR